MSERRDLPPDLPVPHWEMPTLFPEPHSRLVEELLNEALTEARETAEAYAGSLTDLDPVSLPAAIRRYERCVARAQEASCYAELLQSDPLTARCDRAWAELASELAFFEPELGARKPDGPGGTDREGLGPYAHFVAKVRTAHARHLPEAQETVLAHLLPTGGEGWARLAQQLLRSLSVDADGASRSIGEVLPGLYDAERDARRTTHAAVSRALAGQAGLRAFTLAMTVTDGETRAGIRGTDWLHERRVLDQVPQAELDELLAASEECLPLIHSYYLLKRELLGIDDFADYDRYAPVGSPSPEITWAEALGVALSVMEAISPVFAELSLKMIDNGRIDAVPRPGKRQSAYTQSIPGQLPCISMIFSGKPRDVLTLTHELGHAVHIQLAAGQPYLAATPAPVMAETVALFCEAVAVRRLLAEATDPAVRLAWLARWLEDQMVAIGRHAALHAFEVALHDRARAGAALEPEHIDALWCEGQRRLYGPAVRLTGEYRLWWSYLGSLFTSPGSNYAYVYGQLSALTLLSRFEADPRGFGGRLTAMLRLGDTRSPAALLALVTGGQAGAWRGAVSHLALTLEELRSLTDLHVPRSAVRGMSEP
ncbi:M3 family metallopeptidase [Streptomyces sp. NPDC006544]|uniref:M3 family metallopeptidase n=1 Tax=Streptomyces sp. NPDC006544 TaxID=3154583 RepID=UPI0033A2AA08